MMGHHPPTKSAMSSTAYRALWSVVSLYAMTVAVRAAAAQQPSAPASAPVQGRVRPRPRVDADTTGPAGVFGTVSDSAGQPLPETEITATPLGAVPARAPRPDSGPPLLPLPSDTLAARAARTALTDAAGRYRLEGLTTGAVILAIRRVGFTPQTDTLLLEPGMRWRLDVTLGSAPPTLAAVTVRGQADKYHRRVTGLLRRFTSGKGIFVTRAQIDSLNTTFTSDLLREKPGIRVLPGPGGSNEIEIPPVDFPVLPCEIHYFVNGIEWPVASMQNGLDSWSPDEIQTIEIYRYDFETPPEYLVPGPNCGAIAIWTRELKSPHKKSKATRSAPEPRAPTPPPLPDTSTHAPRDTTHDSTTRASRPS